jgi:hypothetical protein
MTVYNRTRHTNPWPVRRPAVSAPREVRNRRLRRDASSRSSQESRDTSFCAPRAVGLSFDSAISVGIGRSGSRSVSQQGRRTAAFSAAIAESSESRYRRPSCVADMSRTVWIVAIALTAAAILTFDFGPPLIGCGIKGNISRNTGERIYHVPGQKYYLRTKINVFAGERWFCSEEAARAAGWRRARI